jgi:hypothetical protein
MARVTVVRIRCGELGCALPVRRSDLDDDALSSIARGVMPKPPARLCAVHKHARAVDSDTSVADVMGAERRDGKTAI